MKIFLLALTLFSLPLAMAYTDDADLEALLAEAREAELGRDEAEASDYFSSLSLSQDEVMSDEGDLDDLLRDAY